MYCVDKSVKFGGYSVRALSLFIVETFDVIDARTSRVLISLVASMTAGAVILMSLEGETSRDRRELADIRSNVNRSIMHEPCEGVWSQIVIHSEKTAPDNACRYHFVVTFSPEDNKVRVTPTTNWKQQVRTKHVTVGGQDYHDSIGICLTGDFSERSPDNSLFEALVTLVRGLQKRCRINDDNVYLLSDLDPHSDKPGKAFPINLFNSRLIHIR